MNCPVRVVLAFGGALVEACLGGSVQLVSTRGKILSD